MKIVKDNFSGHAELYARYRPDYPQELYSFLFSLLNERTCAWDCATGNGQVASVLAGEFEKVYATDISEEQLRHAVVKPNIEYSVQRAETTSFPANMFDLVTVAQAIHWFDFDMFYQELRRTSKPGALFAIMGYGLLKAGGDADDVIAHFYREVLGAYWDKERHYIDDDYQTIPFPFTEISAPRFTQSFKWSLDDLAGYFQTWSAVQHYIKANNQDPVEMVKLRLEKVWGEQSQRTISFDVLLRVARINK